MVAIKSEIQVQIAQNFRNFVLNSNEGAHYLAEALKVNKNVEGMWLKRNHIGANGVRELTDQLRGNASLTTLDLVYIFYYIFYFILFIIFFTYFLYIFYVFFTYFLYILYILYIIKWLKY